MSEISQTAKVVLAEHTEIIRYKNDETGIDLCNGKFTIKIFLGVSL